MKPHQRTLETFENMTGHQASESTFLEIATERKMKEHRNMKDTTY